MRGKDTLKDKLGGVFVYGVLMLCYYATEMYIKLGGKFKDGRGT